MEPAVNSWACPGPKYNSVCFDSNQPNQSLPRNFGFLLPSLRNLQLPSLYFVLQRESLHCLFLSTQAVTTCYSSCFFLSFALQPGGITKSSVSLSLHTAFFRLSISIWMSLWEFQPCLVSISNEKILIGSNTFHLNLRILGISVEQVKNNQKVIASWAWWPLCLHFLSEETNPLIPKC